MLICLCFLLWHNNAFCQRAHDSLYYKTFPNALTVRIYTVKDYTDFSFSSLNENTDIKYRSNATLNLGAGVTYKNLSLNLSYGFDFLNDGIDERGKTQSLDFQFHFFLQKWTSDFLFLHYKGFYASPERYTDEVSNRYYYRPDISLNLTGVSAYYIKNYRKFSYRSAFYQNEWIRKSSGTVLYGGSIYYENIKSGDSSLIPQKVAAFFPNANLNRFYFISVGPGVGYAYALIIKKHFFVLGSGIINANINFATDKNGTINNKRTSFEPGINFKTAIGYGGTSWNATLNWAGNILFVKQANALQATVFPTGEFRLMIAKQIILKKPIPVVSTAIDKVFGEQD